MTRPTNTAQISLAQPNIGPLEVELVNQVLSSDTLAMGSFTRLFEDGIAELVGRRFAVACSSGTAGLHMSVRGLGIGPGDEVITTPFSFVASSNCVLYEGATVRFVDIEETTLGLDPSQVRAAVNDNTAAIIAVDVFGNPCRLTDLEEIARLRDLVLIEDSCEALGSLLDGRALGSFGNASVFAFYPNKQITTGEGGMVVTDDAELARNLRSMRNQGRDEDGTWLRHVQLGYNYRIDELSAALGVAQLRRREEMRRARAQVAAAYDRLLAPYKWVKRPVPAVGATVDWFVYVLQFGPEVDRDRLVTQLERREIPTRPYFSPIHLQPFYRREFGFSPGDYPVTERVAASTLAVPFSSRMTNEMVDHVVDAIASCVAEQGAA